MGQVITIDMGVNEKKFSEQESFKFEYTTPTYDWFDIKKVEIKPDDYVYFELQRRYGPSWWLVGKNPPDNTAEDYHWTETTIGRISERDISRFIEWAKDGHGSRLIRISAISGSFDILRETEKLLKDLLQPLNETVHCKDCENLMFSDCYGECGAAHKSIVRPDDTCEYAVKRKPKEGE